MRNVTRRAILGALPAAAALAAIPETSQATGDDMARVYELIDRHRETYLRWNDLCPLADSNDDRFDPAMVSVVDGLNAQEAEELQALIDEPVTSIEALQAKGAHLAAIDARGGLCYEQAFAFVRSFRNPKVEV